MNDSKLPVTFVCGIWRFDEQVDQRVNRLDKSGQILAPFDVFSLVDIFVALQ